MYVSHLESYDKEKDSDLVVESVDDAKQEARDNIFSKGQSRRIWNELYKVFTDNYAKDGEPGAV